MTDVSRLFKFTPFRILLPSALMLLLFAGSVFFYLLPSLEKILIESRKDDIREMTNSVMSTITLFHDRVEDGDLDEDDAKEMLKDFIRGMRYGPDNSHYFWITDRGHTLILHPFRSDLEGTDLSEYKDPEGFKLFQEFARITDTKGEGFINYTWQWKNQPDRLVSKVGFVKEFKPWGWILGTGLYEEDILNNIDMYRNRVGAFFIGILLLFLGLTAYVLRQAALNEKERTRIKDHRERLLRVLQESEERYRTIADFAYDWEAWVSPENTMLYCSPACQRITGHPPEKFFENPMLIRELIIPEEQAEWDAYLAKAATEEGETKDFRILTAEGKNRWINVVARGVTGIASKPLGVRFSFRDITHRKIMENQLRHQALHDPLTSLANRTLCLDRVTQAMQRAKRRPNYYFAVVFLDIDRFKIINDSLGHRFGDMVLTETAIRLTSEMRDLDTVARFGGDEFVLLLDELSSPSEALRIVKRIRNRFLTPFSFHGNEVQTTASFGIVVSPVPDLKASDVLQYANIAMHRAKEAGRNRFKVFTERMLENAVDQLALENDMRRGLENGEFWVAYQPIVDIEHAKLKGFEALARWEHKERGNIPPNVFVPMAEESGFIEDLGQWILEEATSTLAKWIEETPEADDLLISVNLSTKQFARPELDKRITKGLAKAGLPHTNLKLEITETAIMDNPEAAIRTLKRLRRKGARFSVDDFGKGYSSLSQLQQLPVDTLKVDATFIRRMLTDPESFEIVKAIIALAHTLNLDVIAEGVETPDQLCPLMELHCECVQGYYFHKPMPENEARDLILLQTKGGPESTTKKILEARSACGLS